MAPRLGVGVETLRRWVNQTRVDSGDRPGTAAGEREEIRKLKRENAELRRANEILKTSVSFFRSGTGPPHHEMIAYIDMYRDRFRGPGLSARVLGQTEGGFPASRGYRAGQDTPLRVTGKSAGNSYYPSSLGSTLITTGCMGGRKMLPHPETLGLGRWA